MMGLTALVWASAFIAIKVVVPETGALWLATWRVLIGFLVLLPYALYRGFIWPTGSKVWWLIAITALFNVVIPFFLISWAEQTIDAGVASLLMGTGPFLALIGSHFSTTDDRITLPKALAVVLGFAGVMTIVGVDAVSGLGGDTLLSQLAAIGVGDRVNMLQYSTYSVISPEGCASILWKSADKAPLAAEAMGVTAERVKELDLINNLVDEPLGGAHRNYDAMARNLKTRLKRDLADLQALSLEDMLDQRYKRLMSFGYC